MAKEGALGRLAKDTAWYGLSTILGRLINWLLVPFYVRVLATTGEYGVVTNLYAWTALLLVILTYGMETGFLRFANKAEEDSRKVYYSSMQLLAITSTLFVVLAAVLRRDLAHWMGIGTQYASLVIMLAFIVASDAFMSIPYAYLRFRKRAVRFAVIKLSFVVVNVLLNLFFLLLCPYIYRTAPEAISWCYRPDWSVEYIFVSNLIANAVVFALLIPTMCEAGRGNGGGWQLMKRMLGYSLPLLLLGIAGIFNQMADKILFPLLYHDPNEAMNQLGIYGACFKIAVVMMLFTQAFRYAFEPFFFEKGSGADEEQTRKDNLASVMHYFWIFMLWIFLAVVAAMPILKHIVVSDYYPGLKVVPLVMWGEMMIGIALNLSTWYKLTDRTLWGAIISLLGCMIGVVIIVLGVPRYGFMACAWAVALSNTLMVLISYILGQKYYPVAYNIKGGLLYMLFAAALYGALILSDRYAAVLGTAHWLINILVVLLFGFVAFYKEAPLRHALQRIKQKVKKYGRREG